MASSGKDVTEMAATLLNRGDVVLEALRSVVTDADQSHRSLLAEAQPLFVEVDAAIEKAGIGEVVRPALDHLAHACLGVLEREVRFLELLAEIQGIHEELLQLVTSNGD